MGNELLNVDCLKYMATIPDKFFDLAIVDPPFGINVNHSIGRRKGENKSNYKKVLWDNCSPGSDYFDELFRVSKNQIIWGANHFISKIPFDSSCWIMWDKKISDNLSFSQYELAWTSFKGTCKKFDKVTQCKTRIHPTQKPVALYKWLLSKYAQPGDKILDTHLGSGSSAIAAKSMGFDFVGCELDADYYEGLVKRFNEETAQIKLF